MPVAIYPWQQQQWQQLLQQRAALPHALLFHGREGIGKFDFVRMLAQSLACLAPASGAACGACQSCRWFSAGNHPDYREMLPETMRAAGIELAQAEGRKPRLEIGVDEVRALQDFISLTANHPNGKTIVVYPAERLNMNAANALLKNLEEPPPGTRFMLVSHRPSYLPATIISRCQQVALSTPQAAIAERWLGGEGVADPALSLAHTGNAPLAALALGDGEFWAQRRALLGALTEGEVDALALAERVREFPIGRLLGWLQRWTYDLLSVKSIGRVRYNLDFEAALTTLAARLHAADIARFHRALVRQQRYINHPLNPRLFIEQSLLSYAALMRGESPAVEYAG